MTDELAYNYLVYENQQFDETTRAIKSLARAWCLWDTKTQAYVRHPEFPLLGFCFLLVLCTRKSWSTFTACAKLAERHLTLRDVTWYRFHFCWFFRADSSVVCMTRLFRVHSSVNFSSQPPFRNCFSVQSTPVIQVFQNYFPSSINSVCMNLPKFNQLRSVPHPGTVSKFSLLWTVQQSKTASKNSQLCSTYSLQEQIPSTANSGRLSIP